MHWLAAVVAKRDGLTAAAVVEQRPRSRHYGFPMLPRPQADSDY